MSDHLLRLARIVKEIAVQAPFIDGITRGDAHSLVRDLEAAPQQERRTITREEWALAVGKLSQRTEATASEVALVCLNTWRLTVEG